MNNIENLKMGNYEVSGNYITDGWELFKKNIGGFVSFTFVSWAIVALLSYIPVVGSLANLFLVVLVAGAYLVGQRVWYNESHSFSNFFDGFKHPKMLQLVLYTLVAGMIMALFFIPGVLAMIPYFINMGAGEIGSFPTMSMFLFFLAIIPVFYLSVCWMWAPFFILFKDMDFWPAMETSRQIITQKFGAFFVFLLLLALLNIAGAIAFGVGLLVTMPVTYLALYSSYERIVGTKQGGGDYQDELLKHLVD